MKFQTSILLQKHQRNVHGMSSGTNNQNGSNGISLNNNSIQLTMQPVQRHQVDQYWKSIF